MNRVGLSNPSSNFFLYFPLGVFCLACTISALINLPPFPSSSFSAYEIDTAPLVLIIVTFLLAEPHFFLTFPLLKGHAEFVSNNKTVVYIIPLTLAPIFIYLFIYQFYLFTIIFLAINVYHVNRQSFGILKLQRLYRGSSTYQYLLFFVSIVIFWDKFSSDSLLSGEVALLIYVMSYRYFVPKQFQLGSFLRYLTPALIWVPLLFIDNIVLALACGITIHYLQYLFMGWRVLNKGLSIPWRRIAFFALLYSALTTTILTLGVDGVSFFVLIPTMAQLYHFYIDGFIWRVSDETLAPALRRSF